MTAKEREFLKQLIQSRYYSICHQCFRDIDLRLGRHVLDANGNVIHRLCPPITPKYT